MNTRKVYVKFEDNENSDGYEVLVRCPKCESRDITEYIYGDTDPDFHEKIMQSGSKMISMGCDRDMDSPLFRCNSCRTGYSEIDVFDISRGDFPNMTREHKH